MQVTSTELEQWRREAASRWPSLPVASACPEGRAGTAFGAEVVLATLALTGHREALRILEDEYFAPLRDTLRQRWAPDAVDDALQALRERLLVGPEAQLRDWPASDRLGRWLRVCAVRELATATRPRPEVSVSDSPVLLGDDLNHRHQAALREAISRAVERLEPAQRGILKLHLLENVSVESIAHLHQVSRSTMTRWLAEARAVLASTVREEARARLEVGDETLDSVAGSLVGRLDISLAGFLKGAGK